MNKLFTFVAAAALALLVVLPAGAGPSRSSAGSQTYNDPTGDSADAADISALTVSNDDAGLLTFRFTYANRAPGLTGDDAVIILLDTDRNEQTGDPDLGTEYAVFFLASQQNGVLLRWQNNEYQETPQTTFRATPDGLQLQVNRREMGNTTAFDFGAVTFRDLEGNESADGIPDGSLATYQLVLPQIRSVVPRYSPANPRAGRRFSVPGATVRLTNGQNVAPSTITCTARLAGRALRPVGRCAWRIPANARGKRLVVTVTVTYQGQRRTAAPRAFRVR
jgi:hypothetical protein